MNTFLNKKIIATGWSALALCFLALGVSGCSVSYSNDTPPLDTAKTVYIMPFANQSTMPMAQAQVEQLVASVFASEGLKVEVYPKEHVNDIESSLNPERRRAVAQAWLAQQESGYVVEGSVHEWQYKYGLDGEPTVGLTLTLSDMNQQIIWRNSASNSGWGRESITKLGLETIDEMIKTLPWND